MRWLVQINHQCQSPVSITSVNFSKQTHQQPQQQLPNIYRGNVYLKIHCIALQNQYLPVFGTLI